MSAGLFIDYKCVKERERERGKRSVKSLFRIEKSMSNLFLLHNICVLYDNYNNNMTKVHREERENHRRGARQGFFLDEA